MVKQTIQIFGRIKPTKRTVAVYSVDNEEQTSASLEFVVPKDLADGFVNNKRECYKFRFKKVFDQDARQEDIFESIAKPVAESVLAGYNGTIFAYGQTGSGKTFTITGGAERYSDRGVIPRTLSYLYERFSQDSSMIYTTHISYLEIYNEVGYDLLDSQHEASRLEDLQKVVIMEDPEQNIHLRNLSLQQSANEEEALNLLFQGDTNRMIAETPMNQASTRSHCIFTVHLCRREPGSATLLRSKLHLVDLAGSDRVSKTGLNGQLLTEAKYINLSLHYLEQVIIALSEKNRSHIPYRNSMLTSVLRDSLGGNCMTTMIATMAVDKRNLDESISTCRFAQRVALIKNEAILNEELDPSLLIARLKNEVLLLKEELAMVTGEQRDEQLSAEDIWKLEELVKAFLKDPDPNVTLSLGPDMRKIQHCFSLLKMIILEKEGGRNGHSDQRESPAVKEEAIQLNPVSAAEEAKLKEMLRQRDNEISILVKILKKEKKRADDAAAQIANITNIPNLSSHRALSMSTVSQLREVNGVILPADHGGQMFTMPQLKEENMDTFPSNHGGRVSTVAQVREGNADIFLADCGGRAFTSPQLGEGNVDHRGQAPTMPQLREESSDTLPADHVGRALQCIRRGPQVSVEKQEAFEIFIRDHEEHQTIEDNKKILKERSAEARGLGEQLKEARNRITELKKQLETRRKQKAAHGVMGNQPQAEEEFDLVAENLCKQIKQEKVAYMSTIGRLKALKTEIEHLQLLLERVKVKIQKDFQQWWSQEASNLQEPESGATVRCPTASPNAACQPPSPGTPGFGVPGLSSTMKEPLSHVDTNPDCFISSVEDLSVPPFPAMPARHNNSLNENTMDFSSSTEQRALPTTTIPYASVPLTGDQQVDADILAFVKARMSGTSSAGRAPPRK
ncbi:kinesin-like protein KIF6 isoform X2 [Melanotaenia boesemani]|uniref:kinesin-like protein KIF6 isoform X2 n=1 Tax=Melanotaenia boesemani TaxID=1250792 RepID=UPI001C0423B7|nr:kinesin-like protein KIF6 isoform X2 [Melanotaenia boesemani]